MYVTWAQMWDPSSVQPTLTMYSSQGNEVVSVVNKSKCSTSTISCLLERENLREEGWGAPGERDVT